jgi:hypothetical protein
MASNFPTNLDNFSNPTTGSKLDSPSHAGQHGDANDAIEALETKIGIGASTAGSATAGYAFVHSSGGTTAWSQVGYQGITSGTATSGQVLTAGTATGTSIWSTPTQGLTLINTTSFSGVPSVSLPNSTFSTTYNRYQIILVITASAGTSINARFRTAGVDYATGTYARQYLEASSTTVGAARSTSQNIMTQVSESNSANENVTTIMELSNLMQTGQYANMICLSPYSVSANIVLDFKVFSAGVTNNFDSMTFIAATGNISGKVMCYGYNE